MPDMQQPVQLDQAPTDAVGAVLHFFRALDERRFDLLAPMLAPGGFWNRQGTELRSKADIDAAMADRSLTMRVHHILTNLYALPGVNGEVDVCGYMLVVRHDPKKETDGPLPLTGLDSIRTMRARLRHTGGQTGGGWRIVSLANDPPTFVA